MAEIAAANPAEEPMPPKWIEPEPDPLESKEFEDWGRPRWLPPRASKFAEPVQPKKDPAEVEARRRSIVIFGKRRESGSGEPSLSRNSTATTPPANRRIREAQERGRIPLQSRLFPLQNLRIRASTVSGSGPKTTEIASPPVRNGQDRRDRKPTVRKVATAGNSQRAQGSQRRSFRQNGRVSTGGRQGGR